MIPRGHSGVCLHMCDIDSDRAEELLPSPEAALHALHVVRHVFEHQTSREFRDITWNVIAAYESFSEDERIAASSTHHSACGLRQPAFEGEEAGAVAAPPADAPDDTTTATDVGGACTPAAATPPRSCGPDAGMLPAAHALVMYSRGSHLDDTPAMVMAAPPLMPPAFTYVTMKDIRSTIAASDLGNTSGIRVDEVVFVLLMHSEQRAVVAVVTDGELKDRFIGKTPWQCATLRMLDSVTMEPFFASSSCSSSSSPPTPPDTGGVDAPLLESGELLAPPQTCNQKRHAKRAARVRAARGTMRMYARNLLGTHKGLDVRIVHAAGLESAKRRLLELACLK